MDSEHRPFQPLDDRLAGKPVDETLFEGTPKHLEYPLREWVSNILDSDESLPTVVATRLRVSVQRNEYPQAALMRELDERLHILADAILQLADLGVMDSIVLDQILEHASSAYRIDDSGRRLIYRVNESAEKSFKLSAGSATAEAEKHLRSAWEKAYGLSPDPTGAYREAVRAVETVVCPIVLPTADMATLGTVLAHLRDAPNKWNLVFVEKSGSPSSAEAVRMVMNCLWTGQISRHGGGKNSREQTQQEAEAAVHTASFIVQMFTANWIKRVGT